jgi:adenylate kinase
LASWFSQRQNDQEQENSKEEEQQEEVVPKIFIAGPPGCGKGTQAKKISEMFHCPHISIGDLVREALQKDNEWSQKAKPIVDSGKYLPQSMINPLLSERLKEEDCKKYGWILDSYPSNFHKVLKTFKEEKKIVIFYVLSMWSQI